MIAHKQNHAFIKEEVISKQVSRRKVVHKLPGIGHSKYFSFFLGFLTLCLKSGERLCVKMCLSRQLIDEVCYINGLPELGQKLVLNAYCDLQTRLNALNHYALRYCSKH